MGSETWGDGGPATGCAFRTITRALLALPPAPAPGTRIVVVGPSTVSAGENFPLTLPGNVVLTTQGGPVIVNVVQNHPTAYGMFILENPNSGIRGAAGAALTLEDAQDMIEVGTGSDDTTFLQDVTIQRSHGDGIRVYPGARLTILEGVTVTHSEIGLDVSGHVTISVPSGHRTTSISSNSFAPDPFGEGWGIVVDGSITIHGSPGPTPGTGTVVASNNANSCLNIMPSSWGTPEPSVIDGLVCNGNAPGDTFGARRNSGILIGGGSNVKLRNSVVLGNGAAGIVVSTYASADGRFNDLSKIDLGTTASLADGGVDYGHNILQALPGAGANNGPGICLFVDPGSGTLNAAGNVFAGPRDCAGPSPGALTVSTGLCNTAGVDIIIATYADGGFIGDAGNYGGNGINVANCVR